MFYRYEIINNGNEDILYLYLDMKYEFSNEYIKNENDLTRRTVNFIDSNKINFKGKKVYLIVNDIVVKVVDISKKIKNVDLKNNYSMDNFLVNLKLKDNSNIEITLRDYILGLLFNNYLYDIDKEVFKCMAILYSTYAYKMMKDYSYVDVDNYFCSYVNYKDFKNKYLNYNDIYNFLNGIIDEVDSIFLMYNNEYILPFIHYSNDGKTIKNSKYPYLSSVKCLWDLASPNFININDYSFGELNKILNLNINSNSSFSIDKASKRICINNTIFTCEEIKKLLNLKSNDIYIIVYKDFIRFITKGVGNSYGLSIFSANEIAKNGAKFYNIIKYFYPKVKIYRYVKELS